MNKIFDKLNIFFYLTFQGVIKLFPDFIIGDRLRRIFYKLYLKKMGKHVTISSYVHIEVPQKIEIGDYSGINMNSWISGGGGLTIGKYVLIGPNVIIHSANHNFSRIDIPIMKQGHTFKKVEIGDDVWIGSGAIILPGVKLKKGCIVAAGAVVTKSFPKYSIIAGIPAKIIKKRYEEEN